MEKIYIYTLSDSLGVRYVGKTKNLKLRLYRHIFDAKNNGGQNKRCSWIKSLLNKGEKPIIEIIDICDENNWIITEQYWISQFKTWGFNLVNETIGGEGNYGRKINDETRLKMSLSKKGKTPKNIDWIKKINIKDIVIQYSLDGSKINEYESASYVKNVLGIKNISKAINKKRCTAGGFIWRLKSEELTHDDILKIKNKHIQQKKKPILQLSKDGNLISEWESVSEVKKTYPHITSVLSGIRKTAGGYFWVYKIN